MPKRTRIQANNTDDDSHETFHLSHSLQSNPRLQVLMDGPTLVLPPGQRLPKRKVMSAGDCTHASLLRPRWDRSIRKWSVNRVDEVALRRGADCVPWWLALVEEAQRQMDEEPSPKPEVEKPKRPVTVRNVHNGIGELRTAFLNKFKSTIEEQLQCHGPVTISPAPIHPDVFSKFMKRCQQVAPFGVFPRLVFHGTKKANLNSIHQKGLVLPKKLHPEGWYTDAIWTATHATTSVGYSDTPMMFACAVLDDVLVCQEEEARKPPSPAAIQPPPGLDGQKELLLRGSKGKIEKKHGRCQHRTTHKPRPAATTPATTQPETSSAPTRTPNVEYNGDWAVLNYDDSYVCPLLTIEYSRSRRSCANNGGGGGVLVSSPARWAPRNPNTEHPEHSVRTLAHAHRGDGRAVKIHRQVVRRMIQRDRFLNRRVHLDKRSAFFLFDEESC